VTSTGFDAGRAPEIPEMMDVLDKLGNPAALTLEQLRGKAPEQFLVCGWMTAGTAAPSHIALSRVDTCRCAILTLPATACGE
jgi:hypothetical protein